MSERQGAKHLITEIEQQLAGPNAPQVYRDVQARLLAMTKSLGEQCRSGLPAQAFPQAQDALLAVRAASEVLSRLEPAGGSTNPFVDGQHFFKRSEP